MFIADMLNYLSCNYNFDSVEAERMGQGSEIIFRARRNNYRFSRIMSSIRVTDAQVKEWLDCFIKEFDRGYYSHNSIEENKFKQGAWTKMNPYFICFNKNVQIDNVIFNNPATIVFWSDGTKTVVKCQNDEIFDPEKGLAMAIAKKYFGNKGNYCNEIKKWTEKYEADNTVEIKFDIKCSDEMSKAVINAQEAIRNMLCGNPFEE